MQNLELLKVYQPKSFSFAANYFRPGYFWPTSIGLIKMHEKVTSVACPFYRRHHGYATSDKRSLIEHCVTNILV